MVKTHAGPKLVGHVSRDATAIEAPERPVAKPTPAAPAAPRKRGRPKQGEVRPPLPPKRLELQPARTLAKNLADLPARCDVGCKRNSKGHQEKRVADAETRAEYIDPDLKARAGVSSRAARSCANTPSPPAASKATVTAANPSPPITC